MKKLIDFGDFLFDELFENKFQVSFTLTDRLYELLKEITHPISQHLIDLDDEDYLNDKVTLLDYDEEDLTKFTYTIPNKLIDTLHGITDRDKEDIKDELKDKGSRYIVGLISKYGDQGLMTKNRTSTTINKVVNKLFPGKFEASGKPGEDLESFREMVLSKRKELNRAFERFKVVGGDDILKYYHQDSYSRESGLRGSNLHGSCMKYPSCQEYLEFYSENEGVKLVILMSDEEEDKIDGRALLWDIEYINGEEVDRKFMDRIYFTYQEDVQLFKSYAKKNGWLNKGSQNMHNDEEIEDLKNGKSGYWKLKTTDTFSRKDTYPYMDTMKYFYYDENFVSNSDYYGDDHYFLEDTRGGYEDGSGIYVDYYGRSFHEDDLIWCELGEEYRTSGDAIWIESEAEYATEWYVDDHFVYSATEGEYIKHEDSVFSEYINDYLHVGNTIECFLSGAAKYESIQDIPEDHIDWIDRYYADHDFIEYFHVHEGKFSVYYFHPNDEKYFIEAYSVGREMNINAHKKWDKDKLFKKDDKYYLLDANQKEIDKVIGQYRLFDSYSDYFEDLILEGVAEGELPFMISEKFKDVIWDIAHPITYLLLALDRDSTYSSVTMVDVSDENDKVEITNSNKMIDYIVKMVKLDDNIKEAGVITAMDYYQRNQNEWKDKFRNKIKLGKFIKKMFGDKFKDSGEPGKDIESFVNKYKSEYDTINKGEANFELVSGYDIIKYYDYYSYDDSRQDTPLHNSCMSEEGCDVFIEFYDNNSPDNVKMLVLYSDENKDKIIARALVWFLDEPEGAIYMDRVYYMYQHHVESFRKYAKERGWIYKKDDKATLYHSYEDKEYEKLTMIVKDVKLARYYPYLDTLYFLYQKNNILSNNNQLKLDIDEMPLLLNSTDGGTSNGVWTDNYDRYVHMDDKRYVECLLLTDHIYDDYNINNKLFLKEDATYFPYYDEYAPNKLIDEKDIIQTTFGEEYKVFKEDAIWLKYYKQYTTERYADDEMKYSNYYNDFIDEKHAVLAHNNDYIFYSKSEEAFLNEEDAKNERNVQLIPEEEIGKITYEKDGKHILKLN